MTGYLRKRNFNRLKLQMEEGNYLLQRMEIEPIQGLRVERVNHRARELTAALRRKDLLEDWFPKAYVLGKELRGEAIGEQNRHKRLAKRIYIVFRGREPWIAVNESWRAKYFEEMTQVQAEELNDIWISTELEESLGGDLWTQNQTPTKGAAPQKIWDPPQETWDPPQETGDQTPRMLLAEWSLAEPSLAEPSLAEPSRDQPAEYDWWV